MIRKKVSYTGTIISDITLLNDILLNDILLNDILLNDIVFNHTFVK